MDSVVTAVRQLFALVTGVRPQFRQQGGSNAENLALQNIQVTYTTWNSTYQFLKYLYHRQGFAWCCRIYLHSFYHGCAGKVVAFLYSEVPMSTKGEYSIVLPRLQVNSIFQSSWLSYEIWLLFRFMIYLHSHHLTDLVGQRISILSVVSVKRIWRSLSLMLKLISTSLFWRGIHRHPFTLFPASWCIETVFWMLSQPLNWNQSRNNMCSLMK